MTEVWNSEGKTGWSVEETVDGEWRLLDADGTLRGRFKDARMLAGHLALALMALERLHEQIQDAKRSLGCKPVEICHTCGAPALPDRPWCNIHAFGE